MEIDDEGSYDDDRAIRDKNGKRRAKEHGFLDGTVLQLNVELGIFEEFIQLFLGFDTFSFLQKSFLFSLQEQLEVVLYIQNKHYYRDQRSTKVD
jgi:hypothetical protein